MMRVFSRIRAAVHYRRARQVYDLFQRGLAESIIQDIMDSLADDYEFVPRGPVSERRMSRAQTVH